MDGCRAASGAARRANVRRRRITVVVYGSGASDRLHLATPDATLIVCSESSRVLHAPVRACVCVCASLLSVSR